MNLGFPSAGIRKTFSLTVIMFDHQSLEIGNFQGESTDNFNWGVRRRVLSEGDGEIDPALRVQEESLSETTPVLSARKVNRLNLFVFLDLVAVTVYSNSPFPHFSCT